MSQMQPAELQPAEPAVSSGIGHGKVVALIAIAVLILVLGIANAILWNLSPAPQADSSELVTAQSAAHGMEAKLAGLQTQLGMLEADTTAKTGDVTNIRAQIETINHPTNAADPAARLRVEQLESDIGRLQQMSQQATQTNTETRAANQFDGNVLNYTTQRLGYLASPTGIGQSATVIKGKIFTVVPNGSNNYYNYTLKWTHSIEPVPGKVEQETVAIALKHTTCAYLAMGEAKGTSGSVLNSKIAAGFTANDMLKEPTAGTRIYCVSNQNVNGELWENVVSNGTFSGTKNINGQVLYLTSLPYTPGMEGAPVVDAAGKIVGIVLGRPKDLPVENMTLVVPIYVIEKEAP